MMGPMTADIWFPEGDFLTERHLATLSTIGPRGAIHVVAVGFTVQEGIVRVITFESSQKVRNVERDPRATVAQMDGPQWLSIAGSARILRDRESVVLAEQLYAQRYRTPKENPQRVVIEITPEKVMGSAALREQAARSD